MTRTEYETISTKIEEVNTKIAEIAEMLGIDLEEENDG